MARWLIIPDIHQQVDAVDTLLEREKGNYDRICSLGDYWDSFAPNASAEETAFWLMEKLHGPPFWLPLLGNHDAQYLFSYRLFGCSGYQGDAVADRIRNLFRFPSNRPDGFRCYTDMRKFFKLYTKIGCWYISHAGIHHRLVPPIGNLDEYLEREVGNATANMFAGMTHPLLEAGYSRGGRGDYGGITWMDWGELKPIPGVNQLVGHTCRPNTPRSVITADSHNHCIDTDGCTFAIIDDTSDDPNDIIIKRWMDRPLQGKRMRAFS